MVPLSPVLSVGARVRVSGVVYTVVRKLGKGGFSEVYLVTPEADASASASAAQRYALKLIDLCPPPHPSLPRTVLDGGAAAANRAVQEVYSELQVLQKLKGDRHCIQLIAHELCAERGVFAVVMEAGTGTLEADMQRVRDELELRRVWKMMLVHTLRVWCDV